MRKPTESELEILQVLWERGASTVREVQDTLKNRKPTGYTTVLKLLQIMFEKGLVTRDESERSHKYAPALEKVDTQAGLVDDLVQRAFSGSSSQLIMRALSSSKITPEDLAKIRALIESKKPD